MPPARRGNRDAGFLYDDVSFGKFLYKWRDDEYILYTVRGQNGPYFTFASFLLGSGAQSNDSLMLDAYKWLTDVRGVVLVFDGGYWQASEELWWSVQAANWDDVILDEKMKKNIRGEVDKFFGSEEKYKRLKVPWKRG